MATMSDTPESQGDPLAAALRQIAERNRGVEITEEQMNQILEADDPRRAAEEAGIDTSGWIE